MTNKILLFGGTFNPIHNGHLIIAREVAEEMGFDRIVLIPSARPPTKRNVQDAQTRLIMIQSVVYQDPLFEWSVCEIEREEKSYTIDSVKYFKEKYNNEVFWLIGEDNLLDLPKWHKIDELMELCTFVVACPKKPSDVTYMGYKNVKFVEVTPIPIRSTMIREKIKNNKSIKYLVPRSVECIIKSQKLYK